MKSAALKPLLFVLGLLLVFPLNAAAQGQLSQCRPLGQEWDFPCRHTGQIVYSDAHLRALIQSAPQVARCGRTNRQTAFPCQLEVGGYAQSKAALLEVRRRIQIARQVAGAIDKKLTTQQIAAIVSTSPGISKQVTPGVAQPQAVPRPRVAPRPRPVDPSRAAPPRCGDADARDSTFPCTLVAGAVVTDRTALRNVQKRVRRAQQEAQAIGRRLSPVEVSRILSSTPGVLVNGTLDIPGLAPADQPSVGVGSSGPRGRAVEEVIDAEVLRRSDQEFATTVAASGQDTGGRRLSGFEKALSLGFGRIRVGATLRNGDRIVSRMGDRVVMQTADGALRVLKDDDTVARRPGDKVRTQTYNDGSAQSVIAKLGGERVVSVRDADGTVLRRARVDANGREFVLIDDTQRVAEVNLSRLPRSRKRTSYAAELSEAELSDALATKSSDLKRRFSLRQVRDLAELRALTPALELGVVRFQPGSAVLRAEQAQALLRVANAMRAHIRQDPTTVFLIEGHTDAKGDAAANLALSDRRAETVALALAEAFDMPPGNMVSQGYGGSILKLRTHQGAAVNRRVLVRNVTGLLR